MTPATPQRAIHEHVVPYGGAGDPVEPVDRGDQIRWRMGKTLVKVDRPEPAAHREVEPGERDQDEEHEAHDRARPHRRWAPALLTPTPSAVS